MFLNIRHTYLKKTTVGRRLMSEIGRTLGEQVVWFGNDSENVNEIRANPQRAENIPKANFERAVSGPQLNHGRTMNFSSVNRGWP